MQSGRGTRTRRRLARASAAGLAAAVALTALAGCGEGRTKWLGDRTEGESTPVYREDERESIFGPGGLNLFGGEDERPVEGTGIGVNSFLWRASLDTVSFMPLASADPFGGVIITDWHSPPAAPNERFKMSVYIIGRSLRADGVRVAVFRQVPDGSGTWRDVPVPEGTNVQIEDAILTKARQLRHETLEQ